MKEFKANPKYIIYSYITRVYMLIIALLIFIFKQLFFDYLKDIIEKINDYDLKIKLELGLNYLNYIVLFIIVLIIISYLVLPILNKTTIKISIKDMGLEYKEGWLFSKIYFIPYDTLQQYASKSNIIAEQFDGAFISISTSFLETKTKLITKENAQIINDILMEKRGLLKWFINKVKLVYL
ncbi:hypothetical protein [Mycoplasma sp. P36-A1]|uniref:hypothetical protein n=1 Tax=Mycoplasma sp. P36-A1 TaxID=3252900 RepID=UPI003C2DE97E